MTSSTRARWFVVVLVAVFAIGSIVLAFNRSTPSREWRWRVDGVLEQHPKCSKQGRAEVPSTCQFQVANPPVFAGEVKLDVRVHNTGALPLCYGLSITTSYLAGLQGFCAKPDAFGTYVVTSPAKYYVDFELDIFVSVDSKSQPLSPIPSNSRSPFSISFSETRPS